MKYIIKTEVEAVLLVDKDAVSIQAIADMLPGVPHFFTDEGIVFPHPDTDGDTVEYGNYVINQEHGISAMSKELFEAISTRVVEGRRKIDTKTVLRVKELKKYFDGYGPEFDEKEIWLGNGRGLSNECKAIIPLDVDSDGTHDFILEIAEATNV